MPEAVGKWLANLWIIGKNSGICIFEQNFMDYNISTDLISGFLVAMLNFGKEMADDDMKAIKFQNLRIFLRDEAKLTYAVAVTAEVSEKDVEKFLDLIHHEFTKRYADKLDNFSGNVTEFEEFGEFVESIVNKKALGIELVKSKVVQLIEDGEGEYRDFIRENAGSLDKFLDIALELKKMGPEGIKKKVTAIADEHKEKIFEKYKSVRNESLDILNKSVSTFKGKFFKAFGMQDKKIENSDNNEPTKQIP